MTRLIATLLTAAAFTASAAEPKVTDLDWEPACGGSNLRVTTVAGQKVLIEAFVEHHAEAREWICAFNDGILASATFRHYRITRLPEGEDGAFAQTMTLDKIAVFTAHDGTPQKMDAALKKDLDTVLAIASKGIQESAAPK